MLGLALALAVLAPALAATHLSVKLTKKPTGFVNGTSASFAWSHKGKLKSTTCKLDSGAAKSCTKGKLTYRNLAAGKHTFVVTVKGTSSKKTAKATWTIDRDLPSPPTSVTGGSASWSATAVTLTASGGGDATSGLKGYQYHVSTNGGAFGSVTSGNPAAIRDEGTSFVQFRTVDKAGNASAWVPAVADAGSTVKVDSTRPAAPALSGVPTGWQNVATETVTASGGADQTGGSGFGHLSHELSTDGGTTWGVETTGTQVTVSAEGTALVRFRSNDLVGNVSPWATATVQIDRVAPTDPAVGGGSTAWQDVASLKLTASGSTDGGSGVSTYQVSTSTDSGGHWTTPADGSSLTVTAQGEALVRFHAVDGAGRTSNWVTGIARIDRTKPTTPTLSGALSGWQNVASQTVTTSGVSDSGGSGLDHVSYETSTDGGTTWGIETTGTQLAVSAQGQTMVRFRSHDFAGNVSDWATATVSIDRSNPTDPAIATSSAAWQSVASIVLKAVSADSGSGIDFYHYQVSTNGGSSWGSVTTGQSKMVTAEGETLVRFQTVDVSGKKSNWVLATARIDRTKPTDPIVSSAGAGWQNATQLNINASGGSDSGGSGFAGYQYQMASNGGSWGALASGTSAAVITQGTTLVRFHTIDGAGNVSAWSQVTVRIDSTPPTDPTVTGGSALWTNAASVAVTASGSTDPFSGLGGYSYQTSTDGGATWNTLVQDTSTSNITAEGTTLVRFRATDNVGNPSNWVTATVKIDRTKPTVPTVAGGSSTWQNVASVTVSGSGSTDPAGGSGLAGYQTRTSPDAVAWSVASAGSATVSSEGLMYVQVRSIDAAGNVSDWAPVSPTAQSTVKIDRTSPTAPSLTGGGSTWTKTAPVTVTAGGSTDVGSGVAGYEYQTSSNGGSTWTTFSGSIAAVANPGDWLVRFHALDNAGRQSSWTQTQVRIDTSAPTSPSVSGGSLSWRNVTQVQFTVSGGSDAGGSLLAGYQYEASTNGGAWSAPATVSGNTVTVTAQGTTVVQVRTIDNAGNWSQWAPASSGAANTAMIDRSAPTLPAVSGGGGTRKCYTSRTVTASGSTDAGSGFSHYEYQVSANKGVTWGVATSGTSVQLTTHGTYRVQFRSVDNLGIASAWAPATANTASTVCIR